MEFKEEVEAILKEARIELDATACNLEDTLGALSYRQIIDSFLQSSDTSRALFLQGLKQAQKAKKEGIAIYFEQMGRLLVPVAKS